VKYDVQEHLRPRGLTGLHPLLVLDVFEHAWMVDYGAGEKGKYVKAFLENVSWQIVEQRFKDSAGRLAPARG
jgi:superoxide dismutase, Fe-Mn family